MVPQPSPPIGTPVITPRSQLQLTLNENARINHEQPSLIQKILCGQKYGKYRISVSKGKDQNCQ